MLATESGGETPPSRFIALAELIVAGLMALISFVLAISMTSLIGSGGIETAEDYLHMTPDDFPRLTFAVLTIVCLRYAYGAYRELAGSPRGDIQADLTRLKRAGFIVAVAACYAAGISWLGFILATALVTLVTSYFLGLRNPLHFLPGVILAPVLIRFVFERLLLISLPRSEIEFLARIEDSVLGSLASLLL